MILPALVIIGKHDVQHVLGDARRGFAFAEGCSASCSNGEASIGVQDHAASVVEAKELADCEALSVLLIGASRPEIADGAKPHHLP